MIKNYYYFTVGILSMLFAVTHVLNGFKSSLADLGNSALGNDTKAAFTYVWQIIGVENFLFGIALLIMATKTQLKLVRFTAWLIMTILLLRWVVILSTAMRYHIPITQYLTDTIAIFAVTVLLWLGTRVRDKKADGTIS